MKDSFLKLLDKSRDIHRILPPDRTKSTNARLEKKMPGRTRVLSEMNSLQGWSEKTPYAQISVSDEMIRRAGSPFLRQPGELGGMEPTVAVCLPGYSRHEIHYAEASAQE